MPDVTSLNPVTMLIAAGFGVLTFCSPCILPLLPAYLAYMTGTSYQDLTSAQTAALRVRIFTRSLAFVVGLAIVFTLFGASASAVGKLMLRNQTLLLQVGGALIILLGFHMTGLVRIPFLDQERRVDFTKYGAGGHLGAFVMGAAFGAGWVPCIGAFLGALLGVAGNEATVLQGAILLFIYALGLGLPFILAGLAFSEMSRALSGVRANMGRIKLASGVMVMIIGVLIFTGKLELVTNWLNETLGGGLILYL